MSCRERREDVHIDRHTDTAKLPVFPSALTTTSIYELYSDYVLKNPFYEVEMPIRVELFDHYLLQLVGSHS